MYCFPITKESRRNQILKRGRVGFFQVLPKVRFDMARIASNLFTMSMCWYPPSFCGKAARTEGIGQFWSSYGGLLSLVSFLLFYWGSMLWAFEITFIMMKAVLSVMDRFFFRFSQFLINLLIVLALLLHAELVRDEELFFGSLTRFCIENVILTVLPCDTTVFQNHYWSAPLRHCLNFKPKYEPIFGSCGTE